MIAVRTLPPWPFYGVLVPPTLVLAAYGGTYPAPEDLIRPITVSVLAVGIVFVLIGAVTRHWHAAAFIVTVASLTVIGAMLLPLYLLVSTAWLYLAWRSVRRREGWDVSPKLTRPLNALVGMWFGVALVTAVVVSIPRDLPDPLPVSVEPGPNVYMILLDGYPRHDSLMEYFGFNNRPFLDELEERGFQVSEQSGTLHPSTAQVVSTMMQMRPLDDFTAGEEWTGTDDQFRRARQALNSTPLGDAYEAAGYTTYSIVSPATATDWRTADVVLDSLWPNEFERNLLENGLLRPVIPFDAMHRAEVLDAFTYLGESVGASPRFVWAHVMSPHSPYVFDSDGGPAPPCPPWECANHEGPPNPVLGRALVGQIQWLNGRVLQAVDHIIEVDPEATVIVWSDHGLRRDKADMDEWLRTLFAARGRAFPDDVMTTDVFPTLLGGSDRSRP